MENLTYVTGNYGKYISVKEKFEQSGIIINYYKCDLYEPDINDIKIIKLNREKVENEIIKPKDKLINDLYQDNKILHKVTDLRPASSPSRISRSFCKKKWSKF